MDPTIPERINQKLSDGPEIRYINRFVRDHVCSTPNKWWDLGIELLSPTLIVRLNVIRTNEGNNSTACFNEMIRVWLETQLDASWKSLIKALKHVDLSSLADKIFSLLQSCEDQEVVQSQDYHQQSLSNQLFQEYTGPSRIDISGASFINGKCSVNFNALLNCIPIIYTKWSLIGIMLGLPTDMVNKIAAEVKTVISCCKSDYEICCCISMLMAWFHNQNPTIAKFIEVIEYPSLSFSNDEIIELKEKTIGYEHEQRDSQLTLCKPQKAPTQNEHDFLAMLTDISHQLKKTSSSIDERTSTYLLISSMHPSVWQEVTDWKLLIKNLKETNLIDSKDVDWLECIINIAGCSEAAKTIVKYKEKTKNCLLAPKVKWEHNPFNSNQGIIQTKTNGLPQCVTNQHYDVAKKVTANFLNCELTDLSSHSSTVGSVSYNWKVSCDIVENLKLPNCISQILLNSCHEAGVTEITIAAGTRRETVIISKLMLQERTSYTKPVFSSSSSQVALTFSPDQDIDYAFTRLSAAVTDMIENIKFSMLKSKKTMSPSSFMSKDVVPIIEAAETFEVLCNILTKAHYWNFLDTRMMEAMVTASMIPAAQQSLENYKKTFFCMKLSEVVPHYVPVIPVKSGHTTIEETLNKDPSQTTIGELHKHRFYLETELLETGTDTLAYYNIMIGSVCITWQIHVDHLYQAYLSINKKKPQLPSQSITHLSIPLAEEWMGLPILWRGQEVGQIGPIETSLDHVRQEPYSLPKGLEWTNLNYDNIDEIADLLDDDLRGVNRHTLQWRMSHPKFKTNFSFGTRLSSSNDLVWSSTIFPHCLNVGGKQLSVAQIHTCGKNPYYDSHNIVNREMMRKVNLAGISQAIIFTEEVTIVRPVVTLTYWQYLFTDPLFPPLPYNFLRTANIRRMTSDDIPKALTLTNQYVSQFEIGQVFQTEEEFSHYLLCTALPGYVISYVVEDPVTASITDLFAFRILNISNKRVATVVAIIPNKTPARQLITDLLLCAKQEQVYGVATQQFGLSSDSFKHFEKQTNNIYFHMYNYRYPEVDEENVCILSYI